MDRSGSDQLRRSGAVFDSPEAPPTSFGDAPAELRAALESCVLADRSHFSRIEGRGPDLLGLLQRLGTADLTALEAGRGRPSVLTTPKGRIVERLFVHRLTSGAILLLGGPGASTRVTEHLGRYTFREKTDLVDATETARLFVLIGPRAGEAVSLLGCDPPASYGSAGLSIDDDRVELLGHDGLSAAGFAMLVPRSAAGAVWRRLERVVRSLGGRPAGELALEGHRVLRGVPAPGAELTEQHNPLEAGLRDAVSFDKGCYVGQEVIARLSTYDKVSRSIVGIELDAGVAAPPRGTPLYGEGREVGTLTSCCIPPGLDRAVGLAYVKHRFVETTGELRVGSPESGPRARLRALPAGTAPRNGSAP